MATKAESMHAVLQRLDYFRQSLAQIDSLLPPPPPPAAAATTAGAAGRSTSTAGRSGAGAGFGGVDPAALRAANERATAATARAEAAESGLRVATAKLDAASKEAQSKSAALTKLAEAHMKVQKEAQGLKERVAKLQEAVAERDESVKLIGDRFVSVQTENATMSVQHAEMAHKLHAAEARLAKAKKAASNASTRVAALTGELRNAKHATNTQRTSAEEVLRALDEKSQELKAAQATIKGLSEQLKAAQDEAKSERASAAREVERASKTAAKSRDAAVAEVERQRSEALNDMDRRFKTVHSEVETLKGARAALDKELKSTKEELARLKESLDTSEAALAETRTARRTAESKASNLELRLEEVTTELKALRNRHDMIEAARMAAEATSESVREDKESLDARVRVLQMREKHLQTLADEAEAANSKAQKEKQEAQDAKAALEKAAAKLTKQLKVVVKEVKGLRKANLTVSEERDRHAAAAESLKEKLAASARMLAEASDARDALEARQGRFSAANESLQNDLRVARSQALFLDSMRASLASQLMRDEDAAAAAVEEKAAEIEFRKQTGGWEYCSANSPPPPITLKDPVILSVLESWTTDQRRLAFLTKWMNDIVTGKDIQSKKFQRGVELTRLSREVRDGFLNLVIPILKQRPDVTIKVLKREHHEVRSDLRIKLSPGESVRSSKSARSTGSGAGSDTSSVRSSRTRDSWSVATPRERGRSATDATPYIPSSGRRRRTAMLRAGGDVSGAEVPAARRHSAIVSRGGGGGSGGGGAGGGAGAGALGASRSGSSTPSPTSTASSSAATSSTPKAAASTSSTTTTAEARRRSWLSGDSSRPASQSMRMRGDRDVAANALRGSRELGAIAETSGGASDSAVALPIASTSNGGGVSGAVAAAVAKPDPRRKSLVGRLFAINS